MVLVFFTQKATLVGMDGIFSYTLSNNPYNYLFIDDIYQEFPQDNGWLEAHILKENYVVEEYDRFNYSAVYHHQRHDVHPPLYYFMVHTISSLFPGRYSNLYTMGINLFALLLSDLILIKICRLLYGGAGYGVVPVMFLLLMESMQFLLTWARMYMMLFLFCLWYLFIHAKMLMQDWKKADLFQMIACIFLGTLTHYYFYVYAFVLSILMCFYLIFREKRHELVKYMYCGIVGVMFSWIFYPWVLFHIFLNDQQKHLNIEVWSLEKGRDYLIFLKEKLFNDHGRKWLFFLVLWCLSMAVSKDKKHSSFRRMAIAGGLVYSLIIYTLDGDTVYYSTALYMSFIIWVSMVLLDLLEEIKLPWEKRGIRIGMAVICAVILCSGSTMKSYLVNAKDVMVRMYNGQSVMSEFRQVPEKYQSYNCIYIEEKQDNLFHNYWFEFGEYQLFKKIPLEEFMRHGIREEDLAGCEERGDGIVVYAPKKCGFDEKDYRWLAADSSYNIYEYVGEK